MDHITNFDIETLVLRYKSKIHSEHRYASYDYCYNYFRKTEDVTVDIEKSCLVLGFYLSSWGMYRGSSFILQKSIKYLELVIQYIQLLNKSDWDIDVDSYNEKNISIILDIYTVISELLVPGNNKDQTLVTKVLLGVFGFIPAFDTNFCEAFRNISSGQCGFRKVNVKSLFFIQSFYLAHKEIIDKLSSETFTIDFRTEQKTTINYTKAKIIDMYGFTYGIVKPSKAEDLIS